MALGPHDDQAARAFVLERGHVEAAALIDHRQHLAAQIDHAFEEFRRLGHARDLLGHLRDLVDRLDRQAEFVVAQPEDQELALFAARSAGRPVRSPAWNCRLRSSAA